MSKKRISMSYGKTSLTSFVFNIICLSVIFLTKIFSRHFRCLTSLGLRFFHQEQKLMNHRPFSIRGEFPYIFFLLDLKKP